MKSFSDFPFAPRKWPFFYGYWLVIVSAAGFILSSPGQTIGVSVFTDSLIEYLKITRLQLSIAYAVGTILSAVVIARTSKLLDTIGPRLIASLSAVGLGLILLFMSQVDRIARFLVFYDAPAIRILVPVVIVTLGFLCMRFFGQGMLSLCSRTMLMKWFVVKRGTMNSIMGVSVSLVFSLSPLIFDRLIQSYGWRGAWIIMGLFMMSLSAVFVFLFFRNTPESCGLQADGMSFKKDPSIEDEEVPWTLKQAKKTFTFWIFNIGTAMFSLYFTALTFHVVSIFEMHGYARHDAISIFFPASWIAVILSLTGGILSDRPKIRYRLKYFLSILLFGLLLSAAGVLLLNTGYGKILIIIGDGIASGMFGLCTSVTWGRYYGREHLGEITGHNMSYLVFFSAMGPSIFGFSHAVTETYAYGVIGLFVILIMLFILSFYANRPKLISLKS